MKNKFCKVLLAALLLLVLIPTAWATEDVLPANQLASDLTSDYGEWRSNARDSEFRISYVDYGIYGGTGYVRISATTETNMDADSVGANMIVEQWDKNKWVVYDNFYFLVYENDIATYAYNMPVESGHYYRLHTNHRAQYWGDLYMIDSYSKSVYVN